MKRFSVCGLALLVLVALVVTTTVRANEDSKKLLNLNLPQISLKKADCCEDDKECCEEKENKDSIHSTHRQYKSNFM